MWLNFVNCKIQRAMPKFTTLWKLGEKKLLGCFSVNLIINKDCNNVSFLFNAPLSPFDVVIAATAT